MLHITNIILCSQNAHVCLFNMKLTACDNTYRIQLGPKFFWLVAFYLCLLKLRLSTKVITLLIQLDTFFRNTSRMSNFDGRKIVERKVHIMCIIIFAMYRQKYIIPFYYVSLDSCIIWDNVYFNTFSYIFFFASPLVCRWLGIILWDT